MTTEEFIKRAHEIHGDKYDYTKTVFITLKTKVCIICPEHGEFWQTPDRHLYRKQGCPECKREKLHKINLLTTEEFIKRAKKVHGDKYDYSKVEYINSRTKVCIICPEHGEFFITPANHISGQGCPKCKYIKIWKKRNDKVTTEEFIKRAKKVHGDKYDYNNTVYKTPKTKVCIICPEHGEFWQAPYNHLEGEGCPICYKNTNISETKLIKFIKDNIQLNIEIHKHFNWMDRKHLDIFIPKLNIGIEYQGIQHFKPIDFSGHDKELAVKKYIKQQKNDYEKFLLCKENGIELLYFTYDKTIPNNYYSKIYTNEKELLDSILTYLI